MHLFLDICYFLRHEYPKLYVAANPATRRVMKLNKRRLLDYWLYTGGKDDPTHPGTQISLF